MMKFLTLILFCCLSNFGFCQAKKHKANIKNLPGENVLTDSNLLINKLNDYKNWSADSLMKIMLPKIEAEKNSFLTTIAWLNTPTKGRNLRETELRYTYADKLLDFSASIMRKMSRKEAWKQLADTIVKSNPLPDAKELNVSPAANTYLHDYAINRLREIGLETRENPKEAKNIIEKQTGLPYDTTMKFGGQFGEDYIAVLVAKKQLPGYAFEKLLANLIGQYTDSKDLKLAKRLEADLYADFPHSQYLTVFRKKIAELERLMAGNEYNKAIVFIQCGDTITSIKQLIASYKGKTVYLDIWGTWCGPCVHEILAYSAPLKEKFKEKNIVFLYLEMDYDDNPAKWKDFIYAHNLTGYHLRAEKDQMEKLWIDLLHTQHVTRFFPTYAIFDAHGDLVSNQAKRPGDGNALYKDLETAMNK